MDDGTDAVDTMMHWSCQCQFYHHRCQCQFYHHRHCLIHTDRTSHEREAGANYNRNDSQISEIGALESWMMVQRLLTLWCTYFSHANFSIIFTAGSIRTELAKNEKQGPTTTEMTAKSVKLRNEILFEADSKDAYDTVIDLPSSNCLPPLSPLDQYGKK